MEDYPNPVTKQSTLKILEQMNINFIYKIIESKEKFFLGFFCYIKNKIKKIPIIVINNHRVNEDCKDTINILIDNEMKMIKLGNTRYRNEEFRISVFEITEDQVYNINFLELDEYMYEDDSELYYSKETVYIIQPNRENYISVSYGKIKDIKKSQFIYSCNLNLNLHGLPIFNSSNNKLIGIHNNKYNFYLKGIYFKYIINEIFSVRNEINIIIDVKEEDKNNKIYFLDNYVDKADENIFELKEEKEDDLNMNDIIDDIKKLNKYNTELFINNKRVEYKKYFETKQAGEYNIKIKFKTNLTNCSKMFAGCKNIKNINFVSFNTKYITNMNYMLYQCENLEYNFLLIQAMLLI